MQPEAPNPQQDPGVQPPSQQAPTANQAFQSSSPYPVGQVMQPIDPNLLKSLPKEGNKHLGLIVNILLGVGLVSALAFGIWAFTSRADYKDNSDQKSALAVEKAIADQKITLEAEFAEKAKSPLDTYTGRAESGSIAMQYPRTWSAHIIERTTGNLLTGYFHPGFVPDIQGSDTAFALKIEVVSTQYADVLRQFEGLVKQNTATLAPYTFPKVNGSLGSIITGKITQGRDNVQGTMVVMPIRDKTLKIWTESNSAFAKDFNETVLANFSYVP